VSKRAPPTAANIIAHESFYRAGFAADLAGMAGEILLALLFYNLFRPVNRRLALLMVLFRLAWAAIFAVNSLLHAAPLVLLSGATYLAAFTPGQLQALALLALRLHALGFNIGLVFFGIDCLLLGWLIVRSTFLPRVLGWLMALAGACYLVNSFAHFLSPPLADILFPWVLFPCLPGEYGLILWLLFLGVNQTKWQTQARTTAQTI
jgi:hypothetical protein